MTTHYQLQQALKAFRDQGYDVKVKLNAKTFILLHFGAIYVIFFHYLRQSD
jgi:hypothetical protein